jgi:pyruvate formate lyase activating enzyme
MKEVIKDKVFFAHGGGATLSGGEPLAQGEFALALLGRMQKEGMHTAIETSLYAPPDLVDQAAERCNGIFADCKIIDQGKHRETTEQDNKIILANLDRLLTGKHSGKVIVRVPLVPGFTDDIENISAIADFVYARNKNVPLELLNYNPLAAAKYPYGNFKGLEPKDCKSYSNEQMEKFRGIVRERGVTCIESV